MCYFHNQCLHLLVLVDNLDGLGFEVDQDRAGPWVHVEVEGQSLLLELVVLATLHCSLNYNRPVKVELLCEDKG